METETRKKDVMLRAVLALRQRNPVGWRRSSYSGADKRGLAWTDNVLVGGARRPISQSGNQSEKNGEIRDEIVTVRDQRGAIRIRHTSESI